MFFAFVLVPGADSLPQRLACRFNKLSRGRHDLRFHAIATCNDSNPCRLPVDSFCEEVSLGVVPKLKGTHSNTRPFYWFSHYPWSSKEWGPCLLCQIH